MSSKYDEKMKEEMSLLPCSLDAEPYGGPRYNLNAEQLLFCTGGRPEMLVIKLPGGKIVTIYLTTDIISLENDDTIFNVTKLPNGNLLIKTKDVKSTGPDMAEIRAKETQERLNDIINLNNTINNNQLSYDEKICIDAMIDKHIKALRLIQNEQNKYRIEKKEEITEYSVELPNNTSAELKDHCFMWVVCDDKTSEIKKEVRTGTWIFFKSLEGWWVELNFYLSSIKSK